MSINVEGAQKADVVYEEFRRNGFSSMEKEFMKHFGQRGKESQTLATMVVVRALLTGYMPYQEKSIPEQMRPVVFSVRPFVQKVEDDHSNHPMDQKIKKVMTLYLAHQKQFFNFNDCQM